MVEKAREFTGKFSTRSKADTADSDLIRANIILDKHAQTFARRAAKISSELLVLEREITLMEADLGEFLMEYYKNFSELPEDDASIDDKNISLFERRSEAFTLELKSIHRKLAKDLHPDVSNFDSKYFQRVQSLYERSDLAELVYIHFHMLEDSDESAICRIDRYEGVIRSAQRKVIRLIELKSEMVSSPEYRLFMRYKIAGIRGNNLFDALLKRFSFNQIQPG